MLEEMIKRFFPPHVLEGVGKIPTLMQNGLKLVERIDGRVETVDNKITYLCDLVEAVSDKITLLMAESNLTPELHDDVLLRASDDPRNVLGDIQAKALLAQMVVPVAH